ncbi:hypothetical protein EDB80DRAFT_716673 [Ilyonectria destructans]|nr:hypothetical protein EDB80DRAFT_716673 [Ilyonectria destructans]
MVSITTLAIIYNALGILTGANASLCRPADLAATSTGNPHGDTLPCLSYVPEAELQLDSMCGEQNLAPPASSGKYNSVPSSDFKACAVFCDGTDLCKSFSYEGASCQLYHDTIDHLDCKNDQNGAVWYDKACFFCPSKDGKP